MTGNRLRLPQLADSFFLTDGGMETTLIFHQGFELPLFASYVLLESAAGREALKRYYRDYLKIAEEHGIGFILESPTWRCSRGWGAKLGHDARRIDSFNRTAIELMEELRREARTGAPIVISGNIGPCGDGYAPEAQLSPDEAEEYHSHQIRIFADTAAEMVAAITMTHTGEAIGVVRAARSAGMPVAIAFTSETDGRLPSGEALGEAIEKVDEATGAAPVYYMVNCAHPDHFAGALGKGTWRSRIRGIRANASRKSHAELDNSNVLDPGDPVELARDYTRLRRMLPNLSVFGGCCGTDHRHIEQICFSCLEAA
ncbi:homocysteine S-methyltransferase family protein [Chelativorans sp. AA-79]|uniref:homocysteine S-methyltransferase family protein n=1 Tax=Chelativorans sp. AA-79 TaxID=3028735 RepID=UPI0023F93821|nr:homocysteine S-methyltransferase family protein [Chelativorans sp. AA-79]WEX12031.1 homocysteine S-methyltransferase family protein [Chelativorans sp. AA-79]